MLAQGVVVTDPDHLPLVLNVSILDRLSCLHVNLSLSVSVIAFRHVRLRHPQVEILRQLPDRHVLVHDVIIPKLSRPVQAAKAPDNTIIPQHYITADVHEGVDDAVVS